MTDLLDNITAKLSEPETQETVGKFLSVLTGFAKGKGEVTVTDTGSLTFRVVDGVPTLSVSQEFMDRLGSHAVILSLDAPATNDVVARLGQVDNTVIRFRFDGVDYHPEISHVIVMRQPLHIQHVMNRKTLTQNEFDPLKEYLLANNLRFEVEDVDTPEPEEVPEEVQKLLKPAREDVPPQSEPLPLVEEEEEPVEDVPPQREPRARVDEPPVSEPRAVRKATTIHVDSDDDADDKVPKEEEAEQTSKTVSISYFKKRKDGSRDRTIGRIGNYVFRINKKAGGKTELVCIGSFESKTRGVVDLTEAEVVDVKRLGYTLASKYQ